MTDNENKNIMNNTDLVQVLTIFLTVVMKYGLPFIMDVLNNINDDVITKEDIDNLKITKEPKDYFDEQPED